MNKHLLTNVITDLVNDYSIAKEYGVSLITIPDFDYAQFAMNLSQKRKSELYFLGFSRDQQDALTSALPDLGDQVKYSYAVEDAETSRNSGDEEVFRILVIKRSEIEKVSSLRWFPEITLEKVYTKSCDYVKNELQGTNYVIEALIRALRCKAVRSMLSFERVLSYLELILNTEANELPLSIKKNFYLLGLCADKNIDSKNPTREDLVDRIKKNHEIVERISNLEQSERQSITNYYSKENINKEIPRLILNYYKTKNIQLLEKMDLEEVKNCLKAAKKAIPTPPTPRGKTRVNPTALAAQLAFDNTPEQIDEVLQQLGHDIDERPNNKKAERIEVDVNDIKLQIKTEPVTETIATQLINEDDFGGVIFAEVLSPAEAIRDIGKYTPELFKKDYLDVVWHDLNKLSTLLADGEKISSSLKKFLEAREKLVPFRSRLQDTPMLQVLSKHSLFEDYMKAFEKLLNAINDDFPKIWAIAPSNAKEIINIVMSLDYVFIIGETKQHAIPTPLHPLYLWKYVELSKEIVSSRGVDGIEEGHLSDDDKAFIVRKADDIPDPLSIMLLTVTVFARGAEFLPLSGRIGMLPVYSNQPQINQSESGIDTLKQQIVRYLCLYPHAGMMLKMTVIDPPSVEVVVAMLKALNNDKNFTIAGIDVSVYRTKEVPNDWIEIEDESLNDGMLGKVKGKRNLNFKLRIIDQRHSYNQILAELSQQQHLLVIFDPNEVKIETTQNNKHIHIHPLCVPKIYKYNPLEENVEIRPASEGGIFTVYSSIIEKLNEHPSAFSHTGTFFHTPLKRETYNHFLNAADWLIILDQSLKSWDISLRAASEKLFYRENNYRSVGIYSNNCRKFIVGYDTLAKQLGNFVPKDDGIKEIIEAIREINDDGLLSIVSHTTNRIFDTNHGKGSLGIAIAALNYKRKNPNALIVGLDTQLAQEWLSDREDGVLPDLIGIQLDDSGSAIIDIIEVKTYADNTNSFTVSNGCISGHAVEQAAILEDLVREMFGAAERITTVSRREILREQVFEGLFQAELTANDKLKYSEQLNELFAGYYKLVVNKNIAFVDFENTGSSTVSYKGTGDYAGDLFILTTIGSTEIQAFLSNENFEIKDSNEAIPAEQASKASLSTMEAAFSQGSPSTADNAVPVDAAAVENATEKAENSEQAGDKKDIEEKCARINKVFRDYGINAYPVKAEMVQEAARFTRFAVELKSGETVRALERFKTDIGIQLEANGEILIDHIKGTRYLSVDVPFAGAGKSISLLEHLKLIDSSSGRLDVVAGQKADGTFEIVDIAKAPHMLIAGTTGSGKTIFLYSIIVSLLYKYPMEDLEFLIVDPKQTDFVFFEDLPNLYGGHVVTDAEEALELIRQVNDVDKEERMTQIRSCRSRDIDSYNEKNPNNRMKRLVIIIDEYADLIQTAEMQGNRKEFEKFLSMLAQKVRSLGIHLIIATQRPSANIVTGVLKANIPYRISFRLPSHTDSQTILDMSGAENLLGKGDMLLVTESDTVRMQGLYISEKELEDFIAKP